MDGDGLVFIADGKQIPGLGVGCDGANSSEVHGDGVPALNPDDIIIISYLNHTIKVSRADIVGNAVKNVNVDCSAMVIGTAYHLREVGAEFASVDVNVGSHLCTSVII